MKGPPALTPDPAIVVFDDDPTGTQTVHGIPVLTAWSVDALVDVLRTERLFYMLTNSRALSASASADMHQNLMRTLLEAATIAGGAFEVISRSDSTLRGHYPLECDIIRSAMQRAGRPVDAELLIPFFGEGGRLTRDDIHYVRRTGQNVPVGDTEFARDTEFGFRSSHLREWIEEKTGGLVVAADVGSVCLADIDSGTDAVARRLCGGAPSGRFVVNARNYKDLEIVVGGIRKAQARGMHFLYRTAASFVRVYGGIAEKPLLTGPQILDPSGLGGLVIAGSHVPGTTAQLERLLGMADVCAQEFSVAEVAAGRGEPEITRVRTFIESVLRENRVAVVYTTRRVPGITGGDGRPLSQAVSDGLSQLVRRLAVRPRFLIAKGGITSSDLATQGLGIRRATVIGQLLPGVSVWRQGMEAKWPGGHLVVFPGNVGDAEALGRAVRSLRFE